MSDNQDNGRDTVVVTDNVSSGGSAVAVVIGLIVVVVLVVLLFVGNPFSSSDTTNINVEAPTGGSGSSQQ